MRPHFESCAWLCFLAVARPPRAAMQRGQTNFVLWTRHFIMANILSEAARFLLAFLFLSSWLFAAAAAHATPLCQLRVGMSFRRRPPTLRRDAARTLQKRELMDVAVAFFWHTSAPFSSTQGLSCLYPTPLSAFRIL